MTEIPEHLLKRAQEAKERAAAAAGGAAEAASDAGAAATEQTPEQDGCVGGTAAGESAVLKATSR